MKIFYVTSSQFYKNNSELYNKTLDIIKDINSNHKIFEFTNVKINEALKLSTGETSKAEGIVRKSEKALKEADVLIADVTQSSAGPGFDIAMALSMKKPVLVLHKETDPMDNYYHHTITTSKSKHLTYKRYNEGDLKRIIEDFLVEAKKNLDTKFILIIPSEIDRYLEWASNEKRMHKAQIVREAMERHMEKDAEWKESQAE